MHFPVVRHDYPCLLKVVRQDRVNAVADDELRYLDHCFRVIIRKQISADVHSVNSEVAHLEPSQDMQPFVIGFRIDYPAESIDVEIYF